MSNDTRSIGSETTASPAILKEQARTREPSCEHRPAPWMGDCEKCRPHPMLPKFGTHEWFAWKDKFIAEAYDALLRNGYPREQSDSAAGSVELRRARPMRCNHPKGMRRFDGQWCALCGAVRVLVGKQFRWISPVGKSDG